MNKRVAVVEVPLAPPHDPEAEGQVAALLVSDAAKCLAIIRATGLQAEHCYGPKATRIVRAAYALADAGVVADNVTVGSWLEEHGELQQVGGRTELARMLTDAITTKNAEHHARAIIAKAQQRDQLREAKTRVAELSSNGHHSELESDVMAFLSTRKAWPEPPGSSVWRSSMLADLLDLVRPCCEASDLAVAIQFMGLLGCVIGPDGPYASVGASRHTPRIFTLLIGATGSGRKGASIAPSIELFKRAAGDWRGPMTGSTTGEGWIAAVRDPAPPEPSKDGKKPPPPPPTDKRLCFIEEEFGRVLARANSEGSILPYVITASYDGAPLAIATRHDPIRATGAHISLLGHTTPTDLKDKLSEVAQSNGFANRFLMLMVKSERELPSPDVFDSRPGLNTFVAKLHDLLVFARDVGRMARDEQAEQLWRRIYPDLNNPMRRTSSEIVGSLCQRGPAYCVRLAMLFALMDGSREVAAFHLLQAVEVWAFHERSVDYLYGDSCGHRDADAVLLWLRQEGRMSREEISQMAGRNWHVSRIQRALAYLLEHKLARFNKEQGERGRPAEIWTATPKALGIDQQYLTVAREFVAALDSAPEPVRDEIAMPVGFEW